MIRRPNVGMRVRILNTYILDEYRGDTHTCHFNSSLCDTGVLVDIRRTTMRSHAPKAYMVEFDLPNWGRHEYWGTEHLEKVEG